MRCPRPHALCAVEQASRGVALQECGLVIMTLCVWWHSGGFGQRIVAKAGSTGGGGHEAALQEC